PTRDGLLRFVERPTEYLSEVLDGLSVDERSALAVVFSRGGRSPVQLQFTHDEGALVEGIGGSPGQVQRAFRALDGTLLSLDRTDNQQAWVFRHPTIGDAIADLLIRDPALVRLYLKRTPIQQVMREVTCGDVGLQN